MERVENTGLVSYIPYWSFSSIYCTWQKCALLYYIIYSTSLDQFYTILLVTQKLL